jgi:hypothetical protein
VEKINFILALLGIENPNSYITELQTHYVGSGITNLLRESIAISPSIIVNNLFDISLSPIHDM